jgi:hypothetical protein
MLDDDCAIAEGTEKRGKHKSKNRRPSLLVMIDLLRLFPKTDA